MVDWTVVSELATGGGTLVLAVATFASVRSSNKAARTAERALLAGLRPLLLPSHLSDEPQKMVFGDGHGIKAPGGFGVVEVDADVIYLGANVRNAGQGIAVVHGWCPVTGTDRDTSGRLRPGARPVVAPEIEQSPLTEFRMQMLDMYVPGGDSGYWLAAIRDRDDVAWEPYAKAIADETPVTVDILYGDYEGGQRTITRFVLRPVGTGGRLITAVRHWNIDRADPR